MAADPLTSATVDDLLNFDSTDDEDPFNNNPSRQTKRDDKSTLSPRGPGKRKASDVDDSLGLDSEVKIKKQRKPIAKLDEARLLSAPGIPKLRADARMTNFLTKKLRIKGKGHEFTDVARLLSYYQLWLDDLYPRAKFADGLQLIEKAGHSRRMQVMRREWIDEGKPGYLIEREAREKLGTGNGTRKEELDDLHAGQNALMRGANNEALDADPAADEDSLFVPDSRKKQNAEDDDSGLPDDDELEALLREQDNRGAGRPASVLKRVVEDDSEGEDDLDALLAEQKTRHIASKPSNSETLAHLKAPLLDEDDDEDMDDLDALLAEQEQHSKPSTHQAQPIKQPSTAQIKESPTLEEDEFPVDDDDDLEALMAEEQGFQTHSNSEPVSSLPSTNVSNLDPVSADETVEPDAADMFSSSPVQGTAQSALIADEEHDAYPVPDSVYSAIMSTSATPGRVGIEEMRDSMAADEHEEVESSIEKAGANQEDDSQGLDAGDMFSSSPVRNE